jgi:ribosomal protein S20
MTQQEDELLARELGKIGVSSAKFGCDIAGVAGIDGLAERLDRAFGAQFAAKYLPTEQHQIEIELKAEVKTILAKAYSFFASNGRVANEEEAGNSPYPKISGVVGSGFLKMNPTVIHAEIIAIEEGVSTLLITAAAKEGLIKQHAAEKAVKRLVESMSFS